jgi:hypothetical protein
VILNKNGIEPTHTTYQLWLRDDNHLTAPVLPDHLYNIKETGKTFTPLLDGAITPQITIYPGTECKNLTYKV